MSILHLNSRFRPNLNDPSCNYQQNLLLPSTKPQNIKKVAVSNCVIPNSLVKSKIQSEPSGAGGAQQIKSVTFPAGQYTLDNFIAEYAARVTAASSLATPAFTVAGSSIDSKLIFAIPTAATVPQTWQIKWTSPRNPLWIQTYFGHCPSNISFHKS